MPKNDEDFDWEEQVGARRFRLRPRDPKAALLVGYLVSQVLGFGALAIVTLVFSRFDWRKMGDFGQWTAGILGFSQFLLIPFGMGFVAAYFWLDRFPIPKDFPPGVKRKAPQVGCGAAFLNTLLACVGAFVVLREGSICLLMASPLLCLFMWLGIQTGVHFWRKNPFLSASLVPLFLLLVFAEANRGASPTLAVSTEFHSSAAPETLWRYTANYPLNPHPPTWWLYRMGLPAPMQSIGKAKIGGRRDCLLSGDVRIGEKIVVAQPNRTLEFIIDRQPQHPEIVHHFELLRGRIELLPDGRGGTTLRGTSWYRLHVAPVAYFDLWSARIVHQTHERVFEWGRLSDSRRPKRSNPRARVRVDGRTRAPR